MRNVAQQRSMKMRQNVLSVGMGAGSLTSQKQAMISYLNTVSDPTDAELEVLRQHQSGSSHHRYDNKFCPIQSNAKTRSGNRHVSTVNIVNNGHVNVAGPKGGTYSSNYQVRNGQKLLEPFKGLPLCFIHAVTIDCVCVHDNADLRIVTYDMKRRMEKCFAQLSPDAIVRGYFDLKMAHAHKYQDIIPTDELSLSYSYPRRDDEIIGMVHPHFLCFEPQMCRDEFREVIATEFPGSKRVCIRKPHTEKVHANGEITHGPQGFAEYSSMEKVELECGKQNGKALRKYIKLDATWDRRTKLIRYGNRSPKTITSQNLDVYNDYLSELSEKRIANNWDDIDYAKRFMYLWLNHSGDIKDIHSSISMKSGVRRDDRFIRDLVRLLCDQSYIASKNFSSNFRHFFWCILQMSCLLANSNGCDQSDTKHTPYAFLYSNSSRHSHSKNPVNAGFLATAFGHTGEEHHQLAPP